MCLRKIRICLLNRAVSLSRFQFFLPIHLLAKLCVHHQRSEIISRVPGEHRSELFVEFEFSMKSGSRCTLVHVHAHRVYVYVIVTIMMSVRFTFNDVSVFS